MLETEIVMIDRVPEISYLALIDDAVRYSIISKPFTFNRMGVPLIAGVNNTAKGKFAENLFNLFCVVNETPIDSSLTSTEFWRRDLRDFIFCDREWDIKNNFLFSEIENSRSFLEAPALIPNNRSGDQWDGRKKRYFASLGREPAFLFTFMEKKPFEVILDKRQSDMLLVFSEKYSGREQAVCPFREEDFFREFEFEADKNIVVSSMPRMVITGFATTQHWEIFVDRSPSDFIVESKRVFKTRITNRFSRVGNLESFASQAGWRGSLKFSSSVL